MPDFEIAAPQDFDKPEVVQLPSQEGTNKAVLLKRPDLIALIGSSDGDVPDILTNLIMSAVEKQGKQEIAVTRETLPEIMQSMDAICKAAFVQPLVWDGDSDNEHLSLKAIAFADKAFVFSWALGAEYDAARSFRDEPGGSVETVPANGAVSRTAKRGAKTEA